MSSNEIDDKALQDEALLTAFALNELDGPAKEAVAKRIAADPAAQSLVEAVRATARQLEGELKKELKATAPAPVAIRATRRMAPAEAAGATRRPKKFWFIIAGSAAAALLVCVVMMTGVANRAVAPSVDRGATVDTKEVRAPQRGMQQKGEAEVALSIEYPKQVFIGTPKAPPANVRLAPSEAKPANAPVVSATPPASNVAPVTPVQPAQPPFGDAQTGHNTEDYSHIVDNDFQRVTENPLSTFSIDVDTGSYSLVRRFLMQNGQLPPRDAVRIEEMINYFDYAYEPPADQTPFATRVEIAPCPWQPQHRLAKIGLKGREIARDGRPLSNLVFLLDVSGSMNQSNKLPLVKQGLKLLVDGLGENDFVSIVVYAGAAGAVLTPTSGAQKGVIVAALDHLQAGGSTNGGQGIQLAYALAKQHFIKGGCNRVILCTDGDFNVGTTDRGSLVRMIEEEAKSGIFLSIFGFGMGNYKDATLEKLADKGNGNYGYIDTLAEAKKLFVEQMSGTLVTIAKDVKIQVEFNPNAVAGYRLIGYENRMLRKEDFNDDTKDAGEIGAGHTVTALYEIVPFGQAIPAAPGVDPLKYQTQGQPTSEASSGEMMTVKLRYKEPDGATSKLLEFPIKDDGRTLGKSTPDFRFAAAVAAFGMILRNSPYKGVSTLDFVQELAGEGVGADRSGYRAEFVQLVAKAKTLMSQRRP